jgi:predicted metal-binding protein
LRKSIEDDAKNAALHEKSLVEEINSLKSQLAAKEKERIETVEALHNMESRCISVGAKLETKTEEFDNLKKDLEKVVREKNYLEKKSLEKDQNFQELL